MDLSSAAADSGRTGLVEIGVIRKPVGLDGSCGVTPHGRVLGLLKVPSSVRLGRDESSAAPAVLVRRSQDNRGYRCLFEGTNTRESAENLRDMRIFVAAAGLPSLDSGEFYQFELTGMAVVDSANNAAIGTVEAVHNYPSVDALEVATLSGRRVLVPMTPGAVQEIRREAKIIVVSTRALEEIL